MLVFIDGTYIRSRRCFIFIKTNSKNRSGSPCGNQSHVLCCKRKIIEPVFNIKNRWIIPIRPTHKIILHILSVSECSRSFKALHCNSLSVFNLYRYRFRRSIWECSVQIPVNRTECNRMHLIPRCRNRCCLGSSFIVIITRPTGKHITVIAPRGVCNAIIIDYIPRLYVFHKCCSTSKRTTICIEGNLVTISTISIQANACCTSRPRRILRTSPIHNFTTIKGTGDQCRVQLRGSCRRTCSVALPSTAYTVIPKYIAIIINIFKSSCSIIVIANNGSRCT